MTKSRKLSVLVSSDVKLIREKASMFIDINNGFKLDSGNGDLLVAAVIGPGVISQCKQDGSFNECVLMEIGLGRGKPYLETGRTNCGYHYHLHGRRQGQISEEQYQKALPVLLPQLQDIVNRRVAQWQCNPKNQFRLPASNNYYKKKGKKVTSSSSWQAFDRGIRFTVSDEDPFLIADLYWAELNLNWHVRHQIEGLVKYIDKRLSHLKGSSRTHAIFANSMAARDVALALNRPSLPFYLKVEVVDWLGKNKLRGKSFRFAEAIAEMIGWNLEETFEKKMSKQRLANPEKRWGNSQLRIIRHQNGFCTFELMPSKEWVKYLPVAKPKDEVELLSKEIEEELEEIPF